MPRERLGVGDVGDGGGLGDLEDQMGGVDVLVSQAVVDRVQERWVAERVAGEVDLELQVGVLFDQVDRVGGDPVVDLCRSAEALGDVEEGGGRDQVVVVVEHPQQQLVLADLFGAAGRGSAAREARSGRASSACSMRLTHVSRALVRLMWCSEVS